MTNRRPDLWILVLVSALATQSAFAGLIAAWSPPVGIAILAIGVFAFWAVIDARVRLLQARSKHEGIKEVISILTSKDKV